MSLRIEETHITDLKSFAWGDKWRALTIAKEQRMKKDYYFARIVRFYGKENNTFEYDIGTESDDYAWLGRKEKFVGSMEHDTNRKSKTFGQRVMVPPVMGTEIVIDDDGNDQEKVILIKGRRAYDFILPVDEKNTEKIKTLIGPLTENKMTSFQVISGYQPPIAVTESLFFEKTVEEIMTHHLHQISLVKESKPNKK